MVTLVVQAVDYRLVSGKDGEVCKISRMNPAMLGNLDITQIICEELAIVSEDQHRTPVISIEGHLENPCNLNFHIKLFADFTVQGFFRAFTWINLTTGELP